MKKSILLGSAAALVAVTGAQAADLPVVEPVDYVKVCDAFGAGFHYIPGTETCLKFSGRVRAEIGIQDDNDDDLTDTSFLNSNFELVVNASSMTEVGMVVGQFAISGSNEGSVDLGDAWISIGENILVGRETSRYDFGGGYGIYDGLYVDEGINQFTFIMPFGNGVSFTLGLEDGRDRRANIAQFNGGAVALTTSSSIALATPATTAIVRTTVPVGGILNADASYGGMEIPEIVASLRVSQGWGSAQISGALHQIRSISTGGTGPLQVTPTYIGWTPGAVDEEFGFAVQAGVELNVGSMTKLKVVSAYADGAMHYIGGGDYYEAVVDVTTGNITDTLDGWYALAAINHDFGGGLNASLTGSYHDFEDQAEMWQIGATVEYEVVENLLVSVAGQYVETDPDGGVTTDDWQAKLRVQRNF